MKITITARNFSAGNNAAVKFLISKGYEINDLSGENFGTGTSEEVIADAINNADAVIAGLEPIGEKVFSKNPNLKIVSKRSIGYDTLDLEACRRHGITAARAAGTVEGAVAEHVMAFILYFARNIHTQNASMHRGEWVRTMSCGAKSRTLGLVGFGGIGKEIAARAVPFGMNVIYSCRHPNEEWEHEYGVHYRSMDELLSESDFISVNVPLTDETRGMFGEKEFSAMKKECVFINIARSQVVDVNALKNALDSGRIKGACIDVFDSEPCTDSPLIHCENAILTPHTAPFTEENFIGMNMRAAMNADDYFNGILGEKYRLI